MTLLAVTVLAAFAIYIMKPEERKALVRAAVLWIARASGGAAKRRGKPDQFELALRARTEWPLIVPALVAYNTLVFAAMLVAGAFGESDTLVRWGANFGPRTTNVEWGRLFDSMFVHAGVLHFLATIAGLVRAGLIMERLAGYVTFSAVYLMAGFFASVVSLWLRPMDMNVGASGAILGIYGFLAATSIWGVHRESGVTIPFSTLKRLAPWGALFVVYNVFDRALPFEAELAGFATGFVAGLVLTADIGEHIPAPRRVAAAVATTFTVAAALVLPLHGMVDVRPEIEWVVRLETGTAARYHSAVERFREGVISAKELADVIERNIVPELKSAEARFAALRRIPQEHRALVARAQEFLRLRDESWRLRVEALHEGNMAILRQAEQLETSSLEALETIKPIGRP